MKKMMMLTLAALMGLATLNAQDSKGVNFRTGTFAELLKQSSQEGKFLFVDMYATWCGPCKYMASTVFTQAQAGEYFNANFVCAKFDAEKGEGLTLAKKYGVRAYPTFLILNSEGKEVGRVVGGAGVEDFIAKVKKAVSEIQ